MSPIWLLPNKGDETQQTNQDKQYVHEHVDSKLIFETDFHSLTP